MPKKKLDPQKVLDIARLYNLHRNEMGVVSFISSSLKVSGGLVGKVTQMVKDSEITFDEAGEPTFTRPIEDILGGLAKTPEDESRDRARKEVVQKHQDGIAGEAVNLHDQYLTVGRAITQAFFTWAARNGLTPQQMREMEIHRVILQALNLADQHPGLVQKIEDMEAELRVYRREVDPVLRLKDGLVLAGKFLRYVEYAEVLGFDLEGSGIIAYYENMLNQYLKGGII